MFNELFFEHLKRPRNVGELDGRRPDVGSGAARGEVCRDRISLQIHLNGDRISEARHRVFGCAGILAAASRATEVLEGLEIREARALIGSDWAAGLELPPDKHHCVALVEEALGRALDEFESKAKRC